MTRCSHFAGSTLLLGFSVLLPLGCSGDDGGPGPIGPAGPDAINATTASWDLLESLDVVSSIVSVDLSGTHPTVIFSLETAEGLPIVGIVPYWQSYSRFVRFTLTKLVPGAAGGSDRWVAYTRDGTSHEPDYDTGSDLVDHDDGTYTFTFSTDLTAVVDVNSNPVAYEPTLTHRVAGQVGSTSRVPLEEQNPWLDFVPDGSAVTRTRNIAVMESCNECHDFLTFHGTRHKVEYCVQCHNPELADGEGDMAFMIHRIHAAGVFTVLDGGADYSEVTYPQDLRNCRKCHTEADAATTEADNWYMQANTDACLACHTFASPAPGAIHQTPPTSDCVVCHVEGGIAPSARTAHVTEVYSENNPELPAGYLRIEYDVVDAAVDVGTGDITIHFKILADGAPLDPANMPDSLLNASNVPFNYPSFLLAYARPQDGISAPADWNNLGRSAAQPASISLNTFTPFNPSGTNALTYDSGTGVITATIPAANSPFPSGATMRAIALQGYLRQDLNDDETYDASLHTVSDVVTVTGDTARREIVSTAKCAACHEFFEGHGGNRCFSTANETWSCQLCHVPNLSSSGRTLDLNHPEDSQNMKDMIHGIHASAARSRAYEHVRNFNNNANIYDWSEVTFPTDASTASCTLCHEGESYQLPLPAGVLATVVRTTGQADGLDPATANVSTARGAAALPNATDWVNSATSSSCFYCHTSTEAWAHMVQNGAELSHPDPAAGIVTNRSAMGATTETCSLCHGSGRTADVDVVHNR